MPADPETLAAIQAVAVRVDAKLDAHQTKSEESTRRVHQRIEEHARESRAMQDQYAAETRIAVGALTTQVASVATELHLHTKHDDEVQQRHDEAIKELQKEDGRLWRTFARAAAGGGVVGAALAKAFEHMGGKGP